MGVEVVNADDTKKGGGGGGGGTIFGQFGFFTTDPGLISQIVGILNNNGGTISWTPGFSILNGQGTVTSNGYTHVLNAGFTYIPGNVSVKPFYGNTGAYNNSNTHGNSSAGDMNYYRGGGVDMNNATACENCGVPNTPTRSNIGNKDKGEGGIDLTLTWSGRVNDFFDATGKVSMVSTGKAIGRVTGPVGVFIGFAQVSRGYYKDGKQFGYNTKKATTGFIGGVVGAWAGFEAGTTIGFEGGFVIGAAFSGIGAIPGGVIGGVIGGFGGAFGGAYYGGQFGTRLIKNKAR